MDCRGFLQFCRTLATAGWEATDLLQSRFVSLLTSLSFDKSSLDDRKLLCSVILHAADLSNPTRRFSQAFEWAERLGDEFQYQVDLEQSLGLPVAPFMLKVVCPAAAVYSMLLGLT